MSKIKVILRTRCGCKQVQEFSYPPLHPEIHVWLRPDLPNGCFDEALSQTEVKIRKFKLVEFIRIGEGGTAEYLEVL